MQGTSWPAIESGFADAHLDQVETVQSLSVCHERTNIAGVADSGPTGIGLHAVIHRSNWTKNDKTVASVILGYNAVVCYGTLATGSASTATSP